MYVMHHEDLKVLLFSVNILLFGTLVLSEDVETAWNDFKSNFNKTYENFEEETNRKAIFTENFNFIVNHNKFYDEGLTSYTTEVNEFTDMTTEEMLDSDGSEFEEDVRVWVQNYSPKHPMEKLPMEIDWREKGAVTPVKNQRKCRACWAFSTVSCLESHHFLKTGKLVSLSAQNLIDCSRDQGNNGCKGGRTANAFTYVYENGGINSNEAYPYRGFMGNCSYMRSKKIASLKSLRQIEKGNEEHLKAAVATVGPVTCTISIDKGFRHYKSGVLYDQYCKHKNYLNHAVVIVGYGTENGKDYWLVRNSWGGKWGNKGYVKMTRNRHNHCDIATRSIFPIMK